jgi:predicted transcriptional regulator
MKNTTYPQKRNLNKNGGRLPMSIVIKSASTEDFFQRAREVAEMADKALPLPSGDKVVTFEPQAFHLLLSGKRLELLRCVRNTGTTTLESLSQATGLTRPTVSKYINSLEKLGLIQFRAASPHGRKKKSLSQYTASRIA